MSPPPPTRLSIHALRDPPSQTGSRWSSSTRSSGSALGFLFALFSSAFLFALMDSPFLRITASAHRGKCARCLQVPRDGGKGGIRKGGNGTVQLLSVAEASSDLKSSPDADKNASTVGVKNRKSQFLAFFFNHWEMFGERRLDDCSRSLSAFGETPVSLSLPTSNSPRPRGAYSPPRTNTRFVPARLRAAPRFFCGTTTNIWTGMLRPRCRASVSSV